MRLFLFRKFFS